MFVLLGGVSLFIENSLASHVHTYSSLSSRLLSVDLYFKGHVKLRIFVVYIPPTSDQSLRDETMDLLISALSEAKRLGFHHTVCGDFNMHLDQFYPIYFNQPQIASKSSSISPTIFAFWHINRMCEYLHANIIAGANAVLPARIVGNDHTPKLPKDLETLIQHYHFLNRVIYSIKLLSKYPHTLSSSHDRKWGLHILKEKEFQDSSIKAHLESRDQNFNTDISSFINSALSRSYHRIVLDRVFIDHPTTPQLLTDPKDVSVAFSFGSPSLEEWFSTVSSMPNGKVPGPSMITYEMLKYLGPATNSLLLTLIRKYFASADIPDLWRQVMVFPIPKPHEWRCQLKNTPAHYVLKGVNFAGLPEGTCHDPIITLESIIHDANHSNFPLWILSQDISKAFDSVNLTMLKFALEHIHLPASAITLILSLFMNHSNWVFTAYGETSSYQVRIGIDQGEVISPLL
ncbi:hypothetical protein RclHR1_00440012 [Rhizophagus clarus]|uniref:Reverse transcriptase domain-containing protein n=1 Tax=Rhizophagus clarus TaxID=94130 RepID=A0A2Z6RGX3_9GLOM|nr:hypothetical protein RclHR1_00440012 [Rhizophagus clarus]